MALAVGGSIPSGWRCAARPCRYWKMWPPTWVAAKASLIFRAPGRSCTWLARPRPGYGRWRGWIVPARRIRCSPRRAHNALPRLSPDGGKLAFINGADIYIHDLERDTTSRLTFSGQVGNLAWAPDGKHLVFASTGNLRSYWVRSDGSGEPQLILESPNNIGPFSFSPDGRRLAYHEVDTAGFDLWTMPLDITDPDHPKPGKPELFLRTPADEQFPKFSPDGRWIAYRSNESGSYEIYVRPFPAGGRWQMADFQWRRFISVLGEQPP
jgi:dipeptidyl aminopeptidase/acylaminoacyl peptidase